LAVGIIASLLVAAIPTIGYVLLVWWCDRYEKEPFWLLAAAFIWGAVPAIFLALAGEIALDPLAGRAASDLGRELVSSSVVAPIVEEIVKALALLLIFKWFRDEFDGVLDGIIYGALVGFGFAMTENVFYLVDEFSTEGWVSFGMLAFLRTILFGLNHAFFTAFAGAGLGLARSSRRRAVKVLAPVLGLLAAIGFHALHNLGATLTSATVLSLLISLVANAGGVLIVVVILILAVRQERRWIAEELRPEIGILLTVDEYHIAQAPLQRLRARRRAASSLGITHGRTVGQFYKLLTELAFRLHRYRNGRASAKDLRAIPLLRQRIINLRPQLKP
jgi:RsiW-degrading membrane proteinase PrsW (M82 family)